MINSVEVAKTWLGKITALREIQKSYENRKVNSVKLQSKFSEFEM